MQIIWFVLFYIDQRILLRKEQENILKLKIKLIGWFIYDKIKRQSTDFPLLYLSCLDTEQKEHIWHSCK